MNDETCENEFVPLIKANQGVWWNDWAMLSKMDEYGFFLKWCLFQTIDHKGCWVLFLITIRFSGLVLANKK